MKERQLSDKMKAEAIGLGLCQQWTNEWEDNTSKDEMVRKFVRGIDFCIDHNWPDVKTIKRQFGDVIHNHGVWADENVSVTNAPMTILNGECVCDATFDGTGAGEVYVRHGSVLRVKATGYARVFVTLRDAGEVYAETEGHAKVFVYRYGGEVKIAAGDVTVREKKKE